MSKASSEPKFVKIVDDPTQPSGSGIGYVLVGIMSILLLAANTHGFSQAFRLPAMFGLVLAILTLVIKLYMLRPRPPHERASRSGLDRAMLYLFPAFLSTLFSAFAAYSIAIETVGRQQPSKKRRESMLVAIEDYYYAVRAKIRIRLELNEARLRELKQESPSQQQQEIASLEEEQQLLRRLLRQAATALRPQASDPTNREDSPDEVEPTEGNVTETALQRKFDEAASLHHQLPRFIRDQVKAPAVKDVSDETILGGKPERFLRDTLHLRVEAIGCWAVPAILEIFIVILLLGNRPQD